MIRRPRVLARIVAPVCVVAVLAACSGDAPLGAAEYRRQVRQVCRDLRRATAALPTPAPTATDRLVQVGREALALEREALGRIQSLDAPGADERAVGRWLALVDRALAAGADSLTALAAGDLAAARAANARGARATTDADTVARTLGVGDCTAPPPG